MEKVFVSTNYCYKFIKLVISLLNCCCPQDTGSCWTRLDVSGSYHLEELNPEFKLTHMNVTKRYI